MKESLIKKMEDFNHKIRNNIMKIGYERKQIELSLETIAHSIKEIESCLKFINKDMKNFVREVENIETEIKEENSPYP